MTISPNTSPVRISSPPDIIGAVPPLVGFHPNDSLVVICLHGPRNRTGLVMRMDLPQPGQADVYVKEVVRRVAAQRADGVVLVCYTGEPDDDDGLPRSGLLGDLVDHLADHGIGWLEVLLVRDGRWWSYSCTKPCCPPEGTPLPDTPSSAVTEMQSRSVFLGRAVLPTREALEQSVRGPIALRAIELAQRTNDEQEDFIVRVIENGRAAVCKETVALAEELRDRFMAGDRDVDQRAGLQVLVGIEDRWARDHLVTWGLDGDREDVLAFLIALAQLAVDEAAPPICAVLACVAYQHGEGALASVALDRALGVDPQYELARLLRMLLDGQVPPDKIRAMARNVRRALAAAETAGGGESAVA